MEHPNALGQPTSLPLGNGPVTQYRCYALGQAPPRPNQWYGRLYRLTTGSVQDQTMTSYDAVGNPTGIGVGTAHYPFNGVLVPMRRCSRVRC